MKIAVISGHFPGTSFKATVNHKIYCDKHDVAYIHCNWPTTQKNKYYNKIEFILSYVDYFDYLFWIDDDAFFLNMDVDLRRFLPQGDNIISICKSPDFKEIKTYFSSGTFFLKCGGEAKEFLSRAKQIDLNMVKDWWKEDLGFFSNGDQDAFVYLAIEHGYDSKIERHHYSAFNSRFEDLERGERPFILHFTGPRERKHGHNREAATLLGRDISLVPESELHRYVEDTKPTSKISLRKKISRKLRCLISKLS